MKKVASLLGLIGCGILAWQLFVQQRLSLSQPDIRGGVTRVADADGDRLYYLTTQWEKRVIYVGGSRTGSSSRTVSWLNTDLWAIDVATAQPVFRKRLKRSKENPDSAAMGVEQGVLWARLPELTGIRLADGVIVADRARIEAQNPSLAGLMPDPPEVGIFLPENMQPLKFVPGTGMIVRLDDARQVKIDPLTLEFTPYTPPRESNQGTAETHPDRKAVNRISYGMDWDAMVRGVAMRLTDGRGDWLGLLSDSEFDFATERKQISHQMNFTQPMRHRLYRGRLKTVETFFGPAAELHDLAVLPESPEFLMGGLLTHQPGGAKPQAALWRREPDSVFVLFRDRLGNDGRLQISRIAGPEGKAAWSTALPLSNMGTWLPGERYALMLGPAPSEPHSPIAEERENPSTHLVSIDLETGVIATFNPDLHRDWPVDETP